ncbi:unnamed protein product [Chrysoparadoxa australica]
MQLEGTRMLEKPRVSKKTMVFALKSQNKVITTMRRDTKSKYMILDERSKKTQNLVTSLLDRVSSTETALQEAVVTIEGMKGVDECNEKLEVVKKKADQGFLKAKRYLHLLRRLSSHQSFFPNVFLPYSLEPLVPRVDALETTTSHLPADNVFMVNADSGEPETASSVLRGLNKDLAEQASKIQGHSKAIRVNSNQLESKAAKQVEDAIVLVKEDVEELKQATEAGREATQHIAQLRQDHFSMTEQMDGLMAELVSKVDKAYTDERIEAKYEEIIDHLQAALNSTEQDEENFRQTSEKLQDLVEQLSQSKADRRELMELKMFITTMEEDMVGKGVGQGGPGGLSRRNSGVHSEGSTNGVSRDEMNVLLESKADKSELERSIAALSRRLNSVASRGNRNGNSERGSSKESNQGEERRGSAKLNQLRSALGELKSGRSFSTHAPAILEQQPDGALAVIKQLSTSMGQPLPPEGPFVGTCLSCHAPIVHPDKVDMYPVTAKGGGFQLWSTNPKANTLRPLPPCDTLPELDLTNSGRHVMGKDGHLYMSNSQSLADAAGVENLALSVARPSSAGS